MTLAWLDHFGSIASILGLLIGMPAVFITLYQAMKTRQEAREVREGTWHSLDCLEFIDGVGNCINVVPLETLHSLPQAGDVVFLPGEGFKEGAEFPPSAYLVESVEHLYSPAKHRMHRRQEARLTKAVAHVTSLNPPAVV
ncbi:MAG: hypothetical protein P4L40_17820 [Terracidiphilus sp.]|nr:hypothetical protein [Terracidiphilus sp.]